MPVYHQLELDNLVIKIDIDYLLYQVKIYFTSRLLNELVNHVRWFLFRLL